MLPAMRRALVLTLVAVLTLAACSSSSKKKTSTASSTTTTLNTRVTGQAFSPEDGSTQGQGGIGIVIDLAFRSKEPDLLKASVRPATQGKPGRNASFPGLVVTLSTTAASLGGSQANLADLFQIVSISKQSDGSNEVWATWINGKASFGLDTDSTLDAYVVNGDAPATVPTDRTGLDVVSNVITVKFHVAGGTASTTTSTSAGATTTTSSSSGRTTTTAKKTTTTTRATTSTTEHVTSSTVTP
jgi:hypothetical protein